MCAWSSTFIGVEGEVPRVQQVHSLLSNLKHVSKNQSSGKEKQGYSRGQLSRSPRAFYKGTVKVGSLALYLVVWLEMNLPNIDVSEVVPQKSEAFSTIRHLHYSQKQLIVRYLYSVVQKFII